VPGVRTQTVDCPGRGARRARQQQLGRVRAETDTFGCRVPAMVDYPTWLKQMAARAFSNRWRRGLTPRRGDRRD
jgi:hypothetical protein